MTEKSDTGIPLDYRNPADRTAPRRRRAWMWVVGGLAALLLLIPILLPSMGRARETANRVKCASNLKQLAQSALLYTNNHQGQLPPDLVTLYLFDPNLDSGVMTCPSGELDRARGVTRQQVAALLLSGDHLDYAWLARGNAADLQADMVLAFDVEHHLPRDRAPGKGINVLFGDGSVTFVNEATAKQIWAQFIAGVRPIRLPASPIPAAASQPSR